jgi:hypothetical protein
MLELVRTLFRASRVEAVAGRAATPESPGHPSKPPAPASLLEMLVSSEQVSKSLNKRNLFRRQLVL